jgi:hypothetical protein
MEKFEFDKRNRYKVAKQCPCGKSNRDGKFSPLKGYTDKGKCHSCNKFFPPETKKNRLEIPAHLVGIPCQLKLALYKIFDKNKVDEVFGMYKMGNYKGETMMPYIDKNDEVRSIKIMKYNGLKRDKERPPYFLHSKIENFQYESCLFGEHLIKIGNKVNVVESEKTALIATIARGGVWVATGGKSLITNITKLNCEWVLCPDNDGIDVWEKFGNVNFAYKTIILQKPKGYDLADLIIEEKQSQELSLEEKWDKEFEELENFFKDKI